MKKYGTVAAIFVGPQRRKSMTSLNFVEAIAGRGLKGDRYCTGEGSYNLEKVGKRQVTLIDSKCFEGSPFTWIDSLRNIVTTEVELLWLTTGGGRTFMLGEALLRGIEYCDPCDVPSVISGIPGFKKYFFNRACIIAEVLQGGMIRVGDDIKHEVKGY